MRVNYKLNTRFAFYPLFLLLSFCTTSQKPTSQLVLASAAIEAAERVLAEKRSPDLFNRAQNAYWKAQRLYLAKEFEQAGQAAYQARRLAERAELDAELKSAQSSGAFGQDPL